VALIELGLRQKSMEPAQVQAEAALIEEQLQTDKPLIAEIGAQVARLREQLFDYEDRLAEALKTTT